jgi:hypothetical protein
MAGKEPSTRKEYKGYQRIVIPTGTARDGTKYNLELSIYQARAVVEYFHDIQEFIEEENEASRNRSR